MVVYQDVKLQGGSHALANIVNSLVPGVCGSNLTSIMFMHMLGWQNTIDDKSTLV